MLLLAVALAAHPIHTTSATLDLAAATGEARLVIRAFVEDFPPGADSAGAARYLAARLVFRAPGGRTLPATLRRLAVAGGVLTLEVGVAAPDSWRGVTLSNQLLCERFADQVNVVQDRRGGRARTLLFTPGSPGQALGEIQANSAGVH